MYVVTMSPGERLKYDLLQPPGLFQLLCLLSLATVSVSQQQIVKSCEILKTSRLNMSVPHVQALQIGYQETTKIIGMAAIFLKKTTSMKTGNIRTFKTKIGDILCKDNYIPINDLTDDNLITVRGPNQALITDLTFYKQGEEMECAINAPFPRTFNKENCLKMIEAANQQLHQPKQSLDDLELKPGRNPIFLTNEKFTAVKPKMTICKNEDTQLDALISEMSKQSIKLMDQFKIMDAALGSRYEESIRMATQRCQYEDLEQLLASDIKPKEIATCFKIPYTTNQGGRKKREMSLLEVNEAGTDAELVNQINSNLLKLNTNQKKLLKELVSLGLEKRIEKQVLNEQQEHLRTFQHEFQGLSLKIRAEDLHNKIINHIQAAIMKTISIQKELEARILDLAASISEAVEGGNLKCKQLSCHDPSQSMITPTSQGISIYSPSTKITSESGKTASCRIENMKIFKNHLKNLRTLNTTHFIGDDGSITSQECLNDYEKCPSDDLRPIDPERDLIEGNLFIQPVLDGWWIQCLQKTVIQTQNRYMSCTMSRSAIVMPIQTAKGTRIGHENIKIGGIASPIKALQKVAAGIYKENNLKLSELLTIHHNLSKLADFSSINSHHQAWGIGWGTSLILIMMLGCLAKLGMRLCKGRKLPSCKECFRCGKQEHRPSQEEETDQPGHEAAAPISAEKAVTPHLVLNLSSLLKTEPDITD